MRTVLLSVLLMLAAPCGAETLSAHKSKAQSAAYPARGQSAKNVVKQYGEPKLKHAAVGGGSALTPPVTRWDYEGYSVFLISDRVIDTVVHDQTSALSHEDELVPVE